jgi:hypothetical protein
VQRRNKKVERRERRNQRKKKTMWIWYNRTAKDPCGMAKMENRFLRGITINSYSKNIKKNRLGLKSQLKSTLKLPFLIAKEKEVTTLIMPWILYGSEWCIMCCAFFFASGWANRNFHKFFFNIFRSNKSWSAVI